MLALLCALQTYGLLQSSQQLCLICTIITMHILQRKKLRLKEAKDLLQDHTADGQQSWDLNPGSLAPECRLLPQWCTACD